MNSIIDIYICIIQEIYLFIFKSDEAILTNRAKIKP